MKGDTKNTENGKSIGSLLDIYPWISTFKTMWKTEQLSVSSLNNLMAFFIRNVQTNVNECQTKPLRADKLRGLISETLIFFLYYYRSQEEKRDEATYLNLMSDLLAMYIDTELKASKRSNECHERISGRIASYLCVYLGDSAEYLLDTLLKVRFMSSNYYQILHPVISKIFRLIPEKPDSSLMYVRYFLIYRIWKRITKDQNAKNDINSKAMASLCSPPTSFPQHIMDYVLPKVPNTHKITSQYLFQQPIELEKSCESFVQFCRQSRGLRNAVEMEQNRSDTVVSDTFKLEDKIQEINENPKTNNSLSIVNSNKHSNVQLNSDKNFSSKLSHKSLTKKAPLSGKIMLIDLTSDDSPDRIIKDKTKINQKRISWTCSLFKRKSIVARNNNEECNNITEDSQRVEDSIKSLEITADNTNWMTRLELTTSEIAELNLPVGNELTMKIDELKLCNQLLAESTESPTLIRDLKSSELLQTKNVEEINSQINSKEISLDNSDLKVIVQTSQLPIEIIEEAEVEVTTTDTNIHVPNECTHNNVSVHNEYLVEVTPSPSDLNVRSDNKINTTVTAMDTCSDLTGPTRDTVLHINKNLQSTDIKVNEVDSSKIQDVEFHENIDGLSLLASVSQRVSHLTTTPKTENKMKEVIKVKDYSSLINLENKMEYNDQKSLFFNENQSINISDDVNIFPDDDIDKVAMHVEVTSSEDVFDPPYTTTIYKQEPINNYCSSNNEQSNESPITSMQAESSIQSDKDDTNVILNGETIVLLQKSPNSNLYIINKAAVENRDDGDDENNLIEKNLMDKGNDQMYSYEIYDSMYRMGQPVSSATSYELTQNTNDSVRTTSMDLKKTDKKKNNNEVISPRRRRVKQEYNGCNNSTCQELVDGHPIHIPSSTSIYRSNYTTNDLYISCRQNYNSVTCGMTVNHSTAPLHSHNNSSRCSCLNCAYDIVAHCGQCILPANETKTTSTIDNSYYIPIQKPTVIQDCSLKKNCNDEKLLCKIEDIDSEKSKKIYQTEIDSKLPLKKRFKSMMSINFAETSIKKEKITGNYPSTPMISIAALESKNSTEVSSKLIPHQINSKKIIRSNCSNETLNGYNNYKDIGKCSNGDGGSGGGGGDKKKCKEMMNFSLENISGEFKKSNVELVRPLKKVKEQKSSIKKTTRRTRSSQRQIPKINYSYMDVDCEWNPSGETKRKRKKTSR